MINATTTQSLEDAKKVFQTGDVILFEGPHDKPIDWFIQTVEGEPYTHAGIIIRQNDQLYIWDAPGGGTMFLDPDSQTTHPGARVAPLDDLVNDYMKSEVGLYYRQLRPAATPDQIAAMNIFIKAADGLPFPFQEPKLPDELNLGCGLAGSYAIGKKLQLTKAGTFFCAHLAAETYMRMGLMAIAPNPANAYDPADFASETLPLTGCSLGPVVKLIYTAPVAATPPASAAQTATAPPSTGVPSGTPGPKT
jgi:hypothetical protein